MDWATFDRCRGGRLSGAGRARLHDELWEDRPGVVKGAFEVPLITEQELEEGLRLAFAERPETVDLRVGGRQLTPKQVQAVTAFDDLPARMGGEIYLYVPSLHIFLPELWLRAREICEPLCRRSGLPGSHLDVDAFIGNYRRGGGIHRDGSDLSYVVSGRKRMHVWPLETFARHPTRDGVDPNTSTTCFLEGDEDAVEHRDTAQVLVGEPGDLIFWPWHHWHAAVGDGMMVKTVNITHYHWDASVEQMLVRSLRQVSLPAQRSYAWAPGVPAAHQARLDAARAAVMGGLDSLDAALPRYWEARGSKMGFREVPKRLPAPAQLPLGQRLRGDPRFPILVSVHDAGRWRITANGHAFAAPRSDAVLALVNQLNLGGPFRVHAPLPADVAVALRELLRCRAVAVGGPDVGQAGAS